MLFVTGMDIMDAAYGLERIRKVVPLVPAGSNDKSNKHQSERLLPRLLLEK